MKKATVIIPCAGKGTRIAATIGNIPKALVMVGNKRVLGHILDCLDMCCSNDLMLDVIVVVPNNNFGEMIDDYLDDFHSSLRIETVVQENSIGEVDAILCGFGDLKYDKNPLVVWWGDGMPGRDTRDVVINTLSDLSDSHSVLGLHPIGIAKNHGVVDLDGNGWVTNFYRPEYAEDVSVIAGFHYFRRADYVYDALIKIVKYNLTVNGECRLSSAMRLMFQYGESFKGRVIDMIDCGTPEGLDRAKESLADGY